MPVEHEGKELDRYRISIQLPSDYPFGPVLVFETGGRIKKLADVWHINPDGSMCVGTPEEIWPTTKNPLNIEVYLKDRVLPFLLRNSMIEREIECPYGERSHGGNGILEYYSEKLGIDDPDIIVQFMLAAVNPNIKGHWPCPCGSGVVIRKCHKDELFDFRNNLAKDAIKYSLRILKQEGRY